MRIHSLLSLCLVWACGPTKQNENEISPDFTLGDPTRTTIDTSTDRFDDDVHHDGTTGESNSDSIGDTPSTESGHQSTSSVSTGSDSNAEEDTGIHDTNSTADTSSTTTTEDGDTGFETESSGSDTNDTGASDSVEDTGNPDGTIPCGSKIWACGNGLDDDNDGFVDLDDPECTSPCDDQEKSFLTDLPGQNSDCKSDCYFDQDSGQGNDHCVWNLTCDSEDPGADIGCGYNPSAGMCEAQIPDQCLDVCVPLLPNGCDCFGCCEVQTVNETRFIYLGSSSECSLDNLDACGSCTFQSQCSNECVPEDCELCFGQDKLPEHCEEASCPQGVTSCTTSSDCSSGQFCQTGCCVVITPG